MPPLEVSPPSLHPTLHAPLNLHDELFFIQYNPDITLCRRWYLVQVDIESTLEMKPDYITNAEYWCVFHVRHPNDLKLSDEHSRWWPEWYRYSRCSSTNDIIYGDRILIQPSVIPSGIQFIQWDMLIPLYDVRSSTLVGPFQLAPIDAAH